MITVPHHYRPQRSCGQGNVFTGVCLSTGGRVSASVHAGMPYPPDGEPPLDGGTPPWMENPPMENPPLMEEPPLDGEPRRMENPPRWRNPPWMENPPDGEPPLEGEPPGWRTPPPGSRLQHTVYERPVCILLECILVTINGHKVGCPTTCADTLESVRRKHKVARDNKVYLSFAKAC